MESRKYVFVRDSKDDCGSSNNKISRDFDDRCSEKSDGHRSTYDVLEHIGNVSELCIRLGVTELLDEAKKICSEVGNKDISLDIVSTAKYIASLNPRTKFGYDDTKFYVSPNGLGCNINGHTGIIISYITEWDWLSSFEVYKSEDVSDERAVLSIMWHMTTEEWPNEYYQWLYDKKEITTIEELESAMRCKLESLGP